MEEKLTEKLEELGRMPRLHPSAELYRRTLNKLGSDQIVIAASSRL